MDSTVKKLKLFIKPYDFLLRTNILKVKYNCFVKFFTLYEKMSRKHTWKLLQRNKKYGLVYKVVEVIHLQRNCLNKPETQPTRIEMFLKKIQTKL